MIRILAVMLILSACGKDETVVERYKDPPLPGPGPGPDVDPPTYPQMQQLLTQHCEKCHATAQFMQSEVALRASSVKEQIWSNRMPKDATLPEEDKARMLAFF